jgi:hypothetical protein
LGDYYHLEHSDDVVLVAVDRNDESEVAEAECNDL